jgi:hypothetical protein
MEKDIGTEPLQDSTGLSLKVMVCFGSARTANLGAPVVESQACTSAMFGSGRVMPGGADIDSIRLAESRIRSAHSRFKRRFSFTETHLQNVR